jgi:hypothetical protein
MLVGHRISIPLHYDFYPTWGATGYYDFYKLNSAGSFHVKF